MIKFDRKTIKQGDRLFHVENPEFPVWFKGMGHGGDVIASYLHVVSNRCADVIFKQKDVLMEART
ncbi:MAG: hypothetical protein JJD98_00420 [Polaromonas sp.]|nr:hypothetical protein [Polaromonas sp.]